MANVDRASTGKLPGSDSFDVTESAATVPGSEVQTKKRGPTGPGLH
jgi:hypothetical protein